MSWLSEGLDWVGDRSLKDLKSNTALTVGATAMFGPWGLLANKGVRKTISGFDAQMWAGIGELVAGGVLTITGVGAAAGIPLMIAGAGSITKSAVEGGKKDEVQDYYDTVKERSEAGLGADYQRLLAAGESRIARMGGQDRIAGALASRGVSDSSEANAFLATSNKTRMEAYAGLQGQLMGLNEQVKARSLEQLGPAAQAVSQQRQQDLDAITGAAGNIGSAFMLSGEQKKQDILMKNINAYLDKKLQGINATPSPADPFDAYLNSLIEAGLIEMPQPKKGYDWGPLLAP